MPSAPKKIIVLEDEPTIRDICKTVLTEEGFQTDVFEDGNLALEALRHTEYDLCLMDIRLPLMGGLEFYGHLQKDFPELIDRVVFTTGDLLDLELLKFIKKTNRPLLPKPFTIGELKIMVLNMLGPANDNDDDLFIGSKD